jgi:hypothetical protein
MASDPPNPYLTSETSSPASATVPSESASRSLRFAAAFIDGLTMYKLLYGVGMIFRWLEFSPSNVFVAQCV